MKLDKNMGSLFFKSNYPEIPSKSFLKDDQYSIYVNAKFDEHNKIYNICNSVIYNKRLFLNIHDYKEFRNMEDHMVNYLPNIDVEYFMLYHFFKESQLQDVVICDTLDIIAMNIMSQEDVEHFNVNDSSQNKLYELIFQNPQIYNKTREVTTVKISDELKEIIRDFRTAYDDNMKSDKTRDCFLLGYQLAAYELVQLSELSDEELDIMKTYEFGKYHNVKSHVSAYEIDGSEVTKVHVYGMQIEINEVSNTITANGKTINSECSLTSYVDYTKDLSDMIKFINKEKTILDFKDKNPDRIMDVRDYFEHNYGIQDVVFTDNVDSVDILPDISILYRRMLLKTLFGKLITKMNIKEVITFNERDFINRYKPENNIVKIENKDKKREKILIHCINQKRNIQKKDIIQRDPVFVTQYESRNLQSFIEFVIFEKFQESTASYQKIRLNKRCNSNYIKARYKLFENIILVNKRDDLTVEIYIKSKHRVLYYVINFRIREDDLMEYVTPNEETEPFDISLVCESFNLLTVLFLCDNTIMPDESKQSRVNLNYMFDIDIFTSFKAYLKLQDDIVKTEDEIYKNVCKLKMSKSNIATMKDTDLANLYGDIEHDMHDAFGKYMERLHNVSSREEYITDILLDLKLTGNIQEDDERPYRLYANRQTGENMENEKPDAYKFYPSRLDKDKAVNAKLEFFEYTTVKRRNRRDNGVNIDNVYERLKDKMKYHNKFYNITLSFFVDVVYNIIIYSAEENKIYKFRIEILSKDRQFYKKYFKYTEHEEYSEYLFKKGVDPNVKYKKLDNPEYIQKIFENLRLISDEKDIMQKIYKTKEVCAGKIRAFNPNIDMLLNRMGIGEKRIYKNLDIHHDKEDMLKKFEDAIEEYENTYLLKEVDESIIAKLGSKLATSGILDKVFHSKEEKLDKIDKFFKKYIEDNSKTSENSREKSKNNIPFNLFFSNLDYEHKNSETSEEAMIKNWLKVHDENRFESKFFRLLRTSLSNEKLSEYFFTKLKYTDKELQEESGEKIQTELTKNDRFIKVDIDYAKMNTSNKNKELVRDYIAGGKLDQQSKILCRKLINRYYFETSVKPELKNQRTDFMIKGKSTIKLDDMLHDDVFSFKIKRESKITKKRHEHMEGKEKSGKEYESYKINKTEEQIDANMKDLNTIMNTECKYKKEYDLTMDLNLCDIHKIPHEKSIKLLDIYEKNVFNTLGYRYMCKINKLMSQIKYHTSYQTDINDLVVMNGGQSEVMCLLVGGANLQKNENKDKRRFMKLQILVKNEEYDEMLEHMNEFTQNCFERNPERSRTHTLITHKLVSFNIDEIDELMNSKTKFINNLIAFDNITDINRFKEISHIVFLNCVNLKVNNITYQKMLRFISQHGISEYSEIDEYLKRIAKISPESLFDHFIIYRMKYLLKRLTNLSDNRTDQKQVITNEEDEEEEFEVNTYNKMISYIDKSEVSKEQFINELFLFHNAKKSDQNKPYRTMKTLITPVELDAYLFEIEDKKSENSIVAGMYDIQEIDESIKSCYTALNKGEKEYLKDNPEVELIIHNILYKTNVQIKNRFSMCYDKHLDKASAEHEKKKIHTNRQSFMKYMKSKIDLSMSLVNFVSTSFGTTDKEDNEKLNEVWYLKNLDKLKKIYKDLKDNEKNYKNSEFNSIDKRKVYDEKLNMEDFLEHKRNENLSSLNSKTKRGWLNVFEILEKKGNIITVKDMIEEIINEDKDIVDSKASIKFEFSKDNRNVYITDLYTRLVLKLSEDLADSINKTLYSTSQNVELIQFGGKDKFIMIDRMDRECMNYCKDSGLNLYNHIGDSAKFSDSDNINALKTDILLVKDFVDHRLLSLLYHKLDKYKDRKVYLDYSTKEYLMTYIRRKLKYEELTENEKLYYNTQIQNLRKGYITLRNGWPQGFENKAASKKGLRFTTYINEKIVPKLMNGSRTYSSWHSDDFKNKFMASNVDDLKSLYYLFTMGITGGSLKESVGKSSISIGFDEFISYFKFGNESILPIIKDLCRCGLKNEFLHYHQNYMSRTSQIYNCYLSGLSEDKCMLLHEILSDDLDKLYNLSKYIYYGKKRLTRQYIPIDLYGRPKIFFSQLEIQGAAYINTLLEYYIQSDENVPFRNLYLSIIDSLKDSVDLNSLSKDMPILYYKLSEKIHYNLKMSSNKEFRELKKSKRGEYLNIKEEFKHIINRHTKPVYGEYAYKYVLNELYSPGIREAFSEIYKDVNMLVQMMSSSLMVVSENENMSIKKFIFTYIQELDRKNKTPDDSNIELLLSHNNYLNYMKSEIEESGVMSKEKIFKKIRRNKNKNLFKNRIQDILMFMLKGEEKFKSCGYRMSDENSIHVDINTLKNTGFKEELLHDNSYIERIIDLYTDQAHTITIHTSGNCRTYIKDVLNKLDGENNYKLNVFGNSSTVSSESIFTMIKMVYIHMINDKEEFIKLIHVDNKSIMDFVTGQLVSSTEVFYKGLSILLVMPYIKIYIDKLREENKDITSEDNLFLNELFKKSMKNMQPINFKYFKDYSFYDGYLMINFLELGVVINKIVRLKFKHAHVVNIMCNSNLEVEYRDKNGVTLHPNYAGLYYHVYLYKYPQRVIHSLIEKLMLHKYIDFNKKSINSKHSIFENNNLDERIFTDIEKTIILENDIKSEKDIIHKDKNVGNKYNVKKKEMMCVDTDDVSYKLMKNIMESIYTSYFSIAGLEGLDTHTRKEVIDKLIESKMKEFSSVFKLLITPFMSKDKFTSFFKDILTHYSDFMNKSKYKIDYLKLYDSCKEEMTEEDVKINNDEAFLEKVFSLEELILTVLENKNNHGNLSTRYSEARMVADELDALMTQFERLNDDEEFDIYTMCNRLNFESITELLNICFNNNIVDFEHNNRLTRSVSTFLMSSIARKETIITETNNILKNKIDELYISINAEGESLADKIEGILDSIKEYEERTIEAMDQIDSLSLQIERLEEDDDEEDEIQEMKSAIKEIKEYINNLDENVESDVKSLYALNNESTKFRYFSEKTRRFDNFIRDLETCVNYSEVENKVLMSLYMKYRGGMVKSDYSKTFEFESLEVERDLFDFISESDIRDLVYKIDKRTKKRILRLKVNREDYDHTALNNYIKDLTYNKNDMDVIKFTFLTFYNKDTPHSLYTNIISNLSGNKQKDNHNAVTTFSALTHEFMKTELYKKSLKPVIRRISLQREVVGAMNGYRVMLDTSSNANENTTAECTVLSYILSTNSRDVLSKLSTCEETKNLIDTFLDTIMGKCLSKRNLDKDFPSLSSSSLKPVDKFSITFADAVKRNI